MRNLRFSAAILSVLLAATISQAQADKPGQSGPELFEKGMSALQGSSATRSLPNAIEHFRRYAELGFSPAQVVLGYFYDTGSGLTPDPREALEWYKKAAQQDDPLAQWLVGRLIYANQLAPRDLNEADKWLEESSSRGNPFAEYLLGRIALERNNYAVAAARFREAAIQGLPHAQRELARLLQQGQGVYRDYQEAYVWLLMSRDTGLHDSLTDLQTLEAQLTPAQIEQAKRRARDMEATMTRAVMAHGCTGWPGEFDAIPAPPPPDLQRFCR